MKTKFQHNSSLAPYPAEPEITFFSPPPVSKEAAERRQVEGWLIAARNGDVAAFGELYRLYSEAIFSYCSYRVGNLQDAEDLTAQVFLRAWQAIGRFEIGGAPFSAWLYRIAHNLVVDYHQSRRRKVEVADAGLDEQFIENIEDDRDESINPLQNALRKMRQETLYQALQHLPEEQQQVIYYRFIEDWSHARIAALLGKKEGTIRGIQFRALETLGKILSKADEKEGQHAR